MQHLAFGGVHYSFCIFTTVRNIVMGWERAEKFLIFRKAVVVGPHRLLCTRACEKQKIPSKRDEKGS